MQISNYNLRYLGYNKELMKKMSEIMIAILVVGGIISLVFNIWNKKNPVNKTVAK